MFDVWMTIVMAHEVVRSRGRELRRESAALRAELQRRIERLAELEEAVEAAGEEMPGARTAAMGLAGRSGAGRGSGVV